MDTFHLFPITIRKLKYIDYAYIDRFENDSIVKRDDLVSLLSWLENRKIRSLEVDERSSIDHLHVLWDDAVKKYLVHLDCPHVWDPRHEIDCVDWLVSHAINLEYEEAGASAFIS